MKRFINVLFSGVVAFALIATAAYAAKRHRGIHDFDTLNVINAGQLKYAGTAITSTASEINALDGITSTVSELNILDGVTATAAELNYNDITAAGTAQASKSVVLDGSSQVDILDVTGSYKVDGNPVMQCETVTVSSAELLALNATPKELVAAPGANLFVSVWSVYIALDYNTTAYDGIAATEDLTIAYTNGSGADAAPPIEATGFLDQSADTQRVTYATGAVVAGGAATAAIAPVSNAAVVLSMDVGEIATGDSPLDVRICYAILPDLL